MRARKCYVPKISELKPGICAEPPSNEVVRAELITVIRNGIANFPVGPERDSYERLVYHLELRPGDKAFHLQLLAHLTHGRHQYF